MISCAIEHNIEFRRIGRAIGAPLVQAINKATSYQISIVIDCLWRYPQAMTWVDVSGTFRAHLLVNGEIGRIGTDGHRNPYRHIRSAKIVVGDIHIVLHADGERRIGSSFCSDGVRYIAVYGHPWLISTMRVDLVGRLRTAKPVY